MDPFTWLSKSRATSSNLYTAALWGYGVQPWRPAGCNERRGEVAREGQGYPRWWHDKMMRMMMEKNLDGNYTRMLRAVLNKSWRQHSHKTNIYIYIYIYIYFSVCLFVRLPLSSQIVRDFLFLLKVIFFMKVLKCYVIFVNLYIQPKSTRIYIFVFSFSSVWIFISLFTPTGLH